MLARDPASRSARRREQSPTDAVSTAPQENSPHRPCAVSGRGYAPPGDGPGPAASTRRAGITRIRTAVHNLEGEAQTVRGLAAKLGIHKPAVTRALDRLEEFDLARRKPDPRDRRSILIQRTATGMKFLRELRRILNHAATTAGISVAPEQSRQVTGDMAAHSAG